MNNTVTTAIPDDPKEPKKPSLTMKYHKIVARTNRRRNRPWEKIEDGVRDTIREMDNKKINHFRDAFDNMYYNAPEE